MQIDDIFDSFRKRITEIQLFRKVVNETTKNELERFLELAHADAETPLPGGLSHFMSNQSMSYYDPETGILRPYGFAKSRVEDRLHQVIKQKNRQYGWLLVEAYEEFEEFLKHTYAWLGMHDWRAWRLREFGNVSFAELSQQPISWYRKAVEREYSQQPKLILSRLRNLYPRLEKLEENNKINRNLRVSVELIGNLRHKIVHARGTIADKDGFVQQVLEGCGRWNNGQPKPSNRAMVETYLSADPDDCFITLIEVEAPLPSGAPPEARRVLNAQFDICGSLISDLMADADLVHGSLSPPPASTAPQPAKPNSDP
ncbi:MAG: hypothetical protein OXP36_00450 [Gammaproteobacteria bacterium]|nr:hypothetical protein [Gammaproteobacteria bacterium]